MVRQRRGQRWERYIQVRFLWRDCCVEGTIPLKCKETCILIPCVCLERFPISMSSDESRLLPLHVPLSVTELVSSTTHSRSFSLSSSSGRGHVARRCTLGGKQGKLYRCISVAFRLLDMLVDKHLEDGELVGPSLNAELPFRLSVLLEERFCEWKGNFFQMGDLRITS